ncbi:hypothetical protein CSV79_15795 [Sporosarcina sp. P13]|uniref:hypothetical protein n=1 Tax=Sporosarcina sp. P13 TaxID=2048263 RepID=UPI000C166BD2|nr:hypothetical protein [Sporosarcina sp. P13]PIC62677.1 hypothetical protein CSV79_15795 [Sporosarcina sp. P13]
MLVTQYYPIGSITVPSSWIAFIVGFVMTYLVIRNYFGKTYGERIGNIFFNVIIIWKFSVILTDFSTVRHYPLSILYFHGGTFGWLLALSVVGLLTLRLAYCEKWQRIDQWALLLALLSWQTIYQIVMVFLNEGSNLVKTGTIMMFLLLTILSFWSYRKNVNTISELASIWIAVHFMVSAFQPGGLLHTTFITTVFIGLLLWGVERVSAYRIRRKEEVQ